MYQAVQQCKYCGANLTLDDLRKPNCTYCGTVLPHHAQAAQHAELVGQVMNQVMAQQAQVQNAWRAGFGVAPMPPPPGAPGSPYADPARIAEAHMAAATRMSRTITTVIAVVIIGSFLLTAGIVIAVVLVR